MGRYYLISDGSWYGCGFVVHDHDVFINGAKLEAGFDSWSDKEYMKKEKK